jgi:ADP-ribosylglycohydrolase
MPSLPSRIRGLVFGQAIGDALGLATEFMSRDGVRRHYPNGVRKYADMVQDEHRRRWQPGDWTDDTEQFLCILDSLLEHRAVRPTDIARRIKLWADRDGRGIGTTTLRVLEVPGYLEQPARAAELVWRHRRRNLAPNGAVMRCSILAAWHHGNPELLWADAKAMCHITHHDPRCVDSCRLITALVATLLRDEPPPSDPACLLQADCDPRTLAWLHAVDGPDIAALHLDEPNSSGYTLRTSSAGWWAAHHPGSFEEGLLAVVHAGGDADTNGAVAGSLLGARFGFEAIPPRWLEGLLRYEELDGRCTQLLSVLRLS